MLSVISLLQVESKKSLAPGSPLGTFPPEINTLEKGFEKQSKKGLKLAKQVELNEIQLRQLSDPELIHNVLQLITTSDPHG